MQTKEGDIIFHTDTEQRKLYASLNGFSILTELITISQPDLSTDMIVNVFGSVKHLSIPSKVKLELVTNSSVNWSIGVDNIALCRDDTAWLSVYGSYNKRWH